MRTIVRFLRAVSFPVAAIVLCTGITAARAAPGPHGPARNSIGFKLGGFFPDGDSDLWRFNEADLTTSPSEFNDFAVGVDFHKQLSNYFALSVELMFYEGQDNSVDRRIGDLRQHSEFRVFPTTIGIRWQPGGQYPGGSAYPGTPRTIVPYLGVGGGLVLWEFEMEGEFEDPADPVLFFTDRFLSDGVAPALTATAGVEIALEGPWSLLVEGRYLWATDDLGADFAGFDELDLSGASFFVGAAVRF